MTYLGVLSMAGQDSHAVVKTLAAALTTSICNLLLPWALQSQLRLPQYAPQELHHVQTSAAEVDIHILIALPLPVAFASPFALCRSCWPFLFCCGLSHTSGFGSFRAAVFPITSGIGSTDWNNSLFRRVRGQGQSQSKCFFSSGSSVFFLLIVNCLFDIAVITVPGTAPMFLEATANTTRKLFSNTPLRLPAAGHPSLGGGPLHCPTLPPSPVSLTLTETRPQQTARQRTPYRRTLQRAK